MKRLPLFLLPVLVLVLVTGTARAQSDALTSDPGYVDVSIFDEAFDAPPNIEVNVRGTLLAMVAAASRASNPDLADLLGDLKAIQVRGFTGSEAVTPQNIAERMDRLGQDLERDGWQPVVRVRENGEHVNMLFREQNGAISGLTVMVAEPDETMLINIVGTIHPEEIGKLGRALDIDPLKSIARVDSSGSQ